jgi:hypothetical protein
MRRMVIKGKLLAKYLTKLGVNLDDFENMVNTCESEDGMCYEMGNLMPGELYEDRVYLEYNEASKLVNYIGADITMKLIDWEEQELDREYIERSFGKLVQGINANQSAAI